MPPFDQGPRLAIDGVGGRQRDLADVAQGALAMLRGGGAHVGTLAAGIGADHCEIGAGALVLVRDAAGITTTSPACSSTVVPSSPPSRTRTDPAAMPSTSCAVL